MAAGDVIKRANFFTRSADEYGSGCRASNIFSRRYSHLTMFHLIAVEGSQGCRLFAYSLRRYFKAAIKNLTFNNRVNRALLKVIMKRGCFTKRKIEPDVYLSIPKRINTLKFVRIIRRKLKIVISI